MTTFGSARKGVVYLIGAGPGDPDLITLKGKSLLSSCDAVVFDDLISLEHIVTLPLQVEKHYVGKRPGKHTRPQGEINGLLKDLARQGKSVARLKGGDPFIFGRGGEEADYLRRNGIEFEIVPGITSGIAVPAYCGIPCTDRRKSSFVIFATGHRAVDKQGESASRVPWEWIAAADTGTVVIYMGVAELGNIVTALLKGGMSPEKPMAIIERGTFSSQRIVVSSLGDIVAKSQMAGIRSPAIIIIGDVVDLHETLSWYGRGPLAGLRVMVARPADQATDIYGSIRSYGAEVLEYPTIATQGHVDEEGWQSFRQLAGGDEGSSHDRWIFFTSENGTRYFLTRFREECRDIRLLAGFKIAAVGYGTVSALEKIGLLPDFTPDRHTVASLAEQFCARFESTGLRAIRVRGNLGDSLLEDRLSAEGARVTPLRVYRTYYPEWPEWVKEQLMEYPPDAILFTSGSSVDGFFAALGEADARRLLDGARTFSIGPTTTEAALRLGHRITAEAKIRSIPGLIDELVEYFSRDKATREQSR